jgi:outer membrane immunogenic protein
MRNFPFSVFAGAALSLAAGGVAAVKAAPPPAQLFSWTGFYVGGNLGRGWSTLDSNSIFTGVGAPSTFGPFAFAHSDPLKRRGVLGGVQIGYNWQPSPDWVYGLEADWQASGQNGSLSYSDSYAGRRLGFTAAGTATTNYDAKVSWFGTVRGRIGFAWDRLLLYGTAGLAYGQVKLAGTMVDNGSTLVIAPPFTPRPFSAESGFTAARVNVGWTVGAGVEGALVRNWTWKAEYLYVDLGSLDVSAPGPFAPATTDAHARFADNIVRVGINHQFGN